MCRIRYTFQIIDAIFRLVRLQFKRYIIFDAICVQYEYTSQYCFY